MDDYTRTRIGLHGVAEGILAGPQHERSGTIRLRVLQGGFATVAEPMLRVAGDHLVDATGGRVALDGSFNEVARAVGVTFTVPGMYGDHADVQPTDPVHVDAQAAARLSAWFERGRQALTDVHPGEPPVLWPEHFDLAVTVDEVNLGVSPGDAFSAEPYAYVGPWSFDPALEPFAGSPFWNAPFGAVCSIDSAPTAESLTRFFRAGLAQVARSSSG